jgi:hypothetical protein
MSRSSHVPQAARADARRLEPLRPCVIAQSQYADARARAHTHSLASQYAHAHTHSLANAQSRTRTVSPHTTHTHLHTHTHSLASHLASPGPPAALRCRRPALPAGGSAAARAPRSPLCRRDFPSRRRRQPSGWLRRRRRPRGRGRGRATSTRRRRRATPTPPAPGACTVLREITTSADHVR